MVPPSGDRLLQRATTSAIGTRAGPESYALKQAQAAITKELQMCGALILLFVVTASRLAPAPQDPPADAITIQEVLTEVQRGLSEAQQQLVAAKIPPLDSVVLHLLTEYNVSGGPKFKVLIFSFGKTWERERSNELTITLKPPKADQQSELLSAPGLASQLVAAIVAAAQGGKDAEAGTPR